jgi:predicted nucleic acid-binding protein
MIVVDSNIIIYLHVRSEKTNLALQVLRKDPYWVAPPLWESEFRNVLDLVSGSDCLAYDCEYVALARQLDTKLVTNDHKILQNFPETALELGLFAGSP